MPDFRPVNHAYNPPVLPAGSGADNQCVQCGGLLIYRDSVLCCGPCGLPQPRPTPQGTAATPKPVPRPKMRPKGGPVLAQEG